ncbi:MAG: aldehyde dehydrogenase family protein, partial [Thermodesulfobacteriota bacterium]
MSKHESLGRAMMLMDGQWVESESGQWLEVEDPGRKGHVAGSVPRATARDVDQAVQAAAKAFKSWKRVPARERGKAMSRIGRDLAA